MNLIMVKYFMEQALSVKNDKGYVLLYVVSIVGMVVFSLAVYFSWLDFFSSQNSINSKKTKQARFLADSCAESGLQQLKNNSSYTGNGSENFAGGNCTYAVSNETGYARKIEAQGDVGGKLSKVKILISEVNTKIVISSWQEVADF